MGTALGLTEKLTETGGVCRRRIVALAYPRVVLMDVAGPCEVFSMANEVWRKTRPGTADPYTLEIYSVNRHDRLRATSGLTLLADNDFRDCRGHIDTLLIPGGSDLDLLTHNRLLLDWLRGVAPRVRRLGSVCTGAFVLAAAGLLDGKSATTHWEDCPQLAREYSRISVCPDRIFVKDGNVYTSAGVTAGMDMALALVEEDLGRELAIKVARSLVMFVQRSSGQSQQSALLESQAAKRQPIRELLVWAAEHPREDLSVESLALRVNMSCRNFSRVFRRTVGKTPARFVEMLRVDAARRMLEETDARLEEIAIECGFGGANTMRRSFIRSIGAPPSEYREQFHQL